MPLLQTPALQFETVDELLESLGNIPASRVRLKPEPGTATEADAIQAQERDGRLCELIDGTLVEKPMGFYEARIGGVIFFQLEAFCIESDLGIAFPADALLRIAPGMLRLPDVSYFSWDHFPGRELPAGAVLPEVPDLAVEVLSESNTEKEMERQRKENFEGGCKLVWEVDAIRKSGRVWTSQTDSTLIGEDGTLDGGALLPGFRLPVAELFARAGKRRT